MLLAVNMQTSFMHPPFGFALFYLRSVAPTDDYDDRITSRRIDRVTTGQIYWGAVPFVLIQILMVGLIITFPTLVSSGLGKGQTVDVDKALQQMQMPSKETKPDVNLQSPGSTPAPDGAGSAAPGAGSESETSKTSDDEAMRRVLESMQKDAPKKP